jgi:hypothetical protein
MQRQLSWFLGVFVLVAGIPSATVRAAEDPLVERVGKAIDSGKAYLLGLRREAAGNWEIGPAGIPYPGAQTSLVLLALLTAGMSPQDEVIQKGLDYLRTVQSDRTYAVALQTMAFAQAGYRSDLKHIQRNVDWLLSARQPSGWSYHKAMVDITDNSNTQYALLGLHEGLRAGAQVNPAVMEDLQKMVLRSQEANGGWKYRPQSQGISLNMTTAGLSNLMITGMDLALSRQKLDLDTGVAEDCGKYDENEPVARALALLGRHFPGRLSRGGDGREDPATLFAPAPFYGLYGIERVGRFTGQRYLGGHDWYEVGCRYLVSIQKANGSWQGGGDGALDGDPLIATSFVLLFLSKGRTPVLISKLAYGALDDHGWNNKRNDVRNLAEFCSRELFKNQPMAWQAFDVRGLVAATRESQKALASELLASPVVFLNGHTLHEMAGKEKNILKEYLENGGFLFAEACCGREDFDTKFRELMKEMFPGSELTPLPPEHDIWTASGKFAVPPPPRGHWPLLGLQHGCKWIVVYSPKPLAGYWEGNLNKEGRGRQAFQLGANVIAYATGLEAPRPRLTRVAIVEDDKKERIKRNYLKVAQLRHEGDWQPAPHAMRNLMAEIRRAGIDAMLEPTPVYPSAEKVLDYYLFYMHGRKRFEQTRRNLGPLHFRLTNGGLLLADACCGSKEFDASFRKFMEELWAEEKLKLEPIPPIDDLYSGELNGKRIDTVRCRREKAGGKGVEPEYREVRPALEGIKYKGRWVVIYSRYDLGCALERRASTDCLGHDYDSAVRLARAAVLYALNR